MATTTRQSNLFATEDWKKLYTTFREADFQSYDYETIRKSFIDYLQVYYPEDFNDFIESSEYIALIDMIAFLAQSMSFRADLNARENFLDLAESRESVLRLARMLSYVPKRNQTSRSFLKLTALQTTEDIFDSNGVNLSGLKIKWNDRNNPDFLEQYTTILNSVMFVSQKFGKPALRKTVNGVRIEEYNLQTIADSVPVYTFGNRVGGTTIPFELVNATYLNSETPYEEAPKPGDSFNMIYRNDGRGNNSVNTGFFFYFKQGELRTADFVIDEKLANRVVNINISNINETDVWLYQTDDVGNPTDEWTKVPAITGNNVIYNSVSGNTRKLYTVVSRADDQIDLVFGDGVFSDIPSGNFRVYFRTSANESYRITPAEMANKTINLDYVSRKNTLETLTLTLSLQSTVANSTASEDIESIRTNAPQQYYSQNRMVNGEDYNVYPVTQYTDIIKSKAINRTSSGISRYLDVKDTTGKYSSTNIYCDDGILYRNFVEDTFTFEWVNNNDILRVLRRNITPILQDRSTLHFYLDRYPRIDLTDLSTLWNNSTVGTNTVTGYFTDPLSNPQQIGGYVGSDRQYIRNNSLVKFVAPEGFYFGVDSNLLVGTPTNPGESLSKWTKVVNVVNDGINQGLGNFDDGTGPVTLSDQIATGSFVTQVIPPLTTTLDIEDVIVENIKLYRDFGLRYDRAAQSWKIITSNNLNTTSDWSLDRAGDTTNTGQDSSWIILFTTDGETYTVTNRGLEYVFESVLETRFYFDSTVKIFDPNSGRTIKDNVKILKFNTEPDANTALGFDYAMEIYNTISESDGYVNDNKVLVTFSDSDDDGVVDNPDVFDVVVDPNTNTTSKLVFFEQYQDYDNFVRSRPATTVVNVNYATQSSIQSSLSLHSIGEVFYATTDKAFFVVGGTATAKTLTSTTSYTVATGRKDLRFHYRHNAPNNRRIDPSPSNIIDLYILTKSYTDAYVLYAQDNTNMLAEPVAPTTEDLRLSFQGLETVKSVSDTIIYNSAKFKPLFGDKAASKLQATFKVVKNNQTLITNNEIKSLVIERINDYFDVNNWDFGDTFYFSELSTYLHQSLTPYISSIVIVPRATNESFGSLYQINSQSDEIFISAATVDNVEIIDAVTSTNLQSSGLVVNNTSGTQSVGASSTNAVSVSSSQTTASGVSSSSSSGSSSGGGY